MDQGQPLRRTRIPPRNNSVQESLKTACSRKRELKRGRVQADDGAACEKKIRLQELYDVPVILIGFGFLNCTELGRSACAALAFGAGNPRL
jgi:hypothetical protein